ncbi:DUF5995 family protein [Streptomyces sp. NPDC097981]|uniref:DUF5995 family protein n=1 Tax=Streptomyces sp. NPDC097981 TaxID=3155428 RepID=UPI003327A665
MRDPRAVFAYTYFRLTSDLAASLRTNALSFAAPEWVADLSVSLAAGYFTAMDAIDTWLGPDPRPRGDVLSTDLPDAVPKPWRDVYAASAVRHSYVLLDRLFTHDDELFTSYGIRVVRGLAWFNCDRLLDPDATAEATGSISRTTAAFIAEFRSPDDWKRRHAFRVLRALVPSRRQWPPPGTPVEAGRPSG